MFRFLYFIVIVIYFVTQYDFMNKLKLITKIIIDQGNYFLTASELSVSVAKGREQELLASFQLETSP